MTLAAPSTPAPAAAAPLAPPKPSKPVPEPKPATPRPVAKTAAKPRAQPVAHSSVAPSPSAPAAEANNNVAAAATATPAPPTPAPAPHVQEPLYRGGYLNNPKPTYPPLSIEMEETGTVRLRVQVSAQGLPVSVELEHSSGFPRLDRAAQTAVRGWKFIPAKRGDEAIPYTFIVPVEFSLKNLRKP
nr:energy transducer TonB [Aquitalea sp. LB_tupeE]